MTSNSINTTVATEQQQDDYRAIRKSEAMKRARRRFAVALLMIDMVEPVSVAWYVLHDLELEREAAR